MARLLADEDFSWPVVMELRRLGHDVWTVLEAGLASRRVPDEQVLRYATAAGRAVLVFNRKHYFRLHKAGVDHSGIVACTRDDDVAALAQRIHARLAVEADLANRVIRITRPHPDEGAHDRDGQD